MNGATPTAGNGPAIDWSLLNELRAMEAEGMPGLAARLVSSYVENSARRLTDLQTAMSAADSDRVRRIAHSIKSTSANVGANPLAELGRALEHAAQQPHWQPKQADVDRITTEYQRVLRALSERFTIAPARN